jgi:hypothetical protein
MDFSGGRHTGTWPEGEPQSVRDAYDDMPKGGYRAKATEPAKATPESGQPTGEATANQSAQPMGSAVKVD